MQSVNPRRIMARPQTQKGIRVLSRPRTLWSWLYYPLSCIAVFVLTLHIAAFDWLLITPIDVGGTFMGGGMATQLYLMGWGAASVGLLLAVVCRLPGSIYGWISAGLLPVGIGAWWQLDYPANADQMILSTSRQEIGVAMLIGAVLLCSGLYARSRIKSRASKTSPSRSAMSGRMAVATMLLILFVGVPMAIFKQQSLPYCAVNKAGQQLTVCLGEDDVPVVVD